MKLIFYRWEWKSLSGNQGSARMSFQNTTEWDTRIQIKLCNFSCDLFGGPSKSPGELYGKRVGHIFLNEHWSISHLLCYFSKNATGELKLRSTAFQVERQVQGNTSDTSLHACMPTHKCFSFSFSYTPLLLLKISRLSRICVLHCITGAEVCTSYTNKQLE